MSKSINYDPPFRSSEPNSQLLDEVSALRQTLRRVIEQRECYREESKAKDAVIEHWQARVAELTQQLDAERLTMTETEAENHELRMACEARADERDCESERAAKLTQQLDEYRRAAGEGNVLEGRNG